MIDIISKEQIEQMQNNTVSINEWKLFKLRLLAEHAYEYSDVKQLCPVCHYHYIRRGYVCFHCGYDDTYSSEEYLEELKSKE